ncbi:uncharacterized protein LOC110689848 [Chenopodium quinoa]|uniref:uncharacterized protein LOC110689848 n=1 Tax=Chenopodium quinoa TaxID=63459 RepID=UPI000B77D319|nr:uncharacterized protein LOC110689848 [Chenopodium quinoa]
MMIAFSAKIKLGFIDGNIPKPASTDVFSAWKRCDAIIISYILRSHDNSIARSVLYLTTSREIWKDLEERYSQTSRLQLFTLQQKLLELNQLRSCSQFIVDNNKKPSPFFSEYWKFPGHTVDKCYKIHGYSPSHGNKFKGKKVAAIVQDDDDDAQDSDDTIASSGGSLAQSESIAGAYVAGTCLIICSNSSWIINSGATDHICSNIDLFSEIRVFDKFPNTITITNGKKVVVNHIGTVKFDNGIQLENVLHVPGFKFNLVSTHKLCKDLNCEVTFTHDKCLIQDTTSNQSLVLGSLSSGFCTVGNDIVCQIHAVHIGFSYFLTVVEDFSRHTWTFLMKNKSDVVFVLNNLVTLTETQFNTKVLSFRADNAKELCEGEILHLFHGKGIVHQRVERKHIHLLETARDTSIPNEPTPEPSPTQSPHSEPQTLTSYVPIRQSTRPRKWPSHFGNFVYIADNVTEHWCNLVRFEFIPSEAKALINTITQVSEPVSYFEASRHPSWVKAMQKEIDALTANETWELVPLPKGKKPIGCKWIFKVKLKADGAIKRLKTRLVAKGFTQKYGID